MTSLLSTPRLGFRFRFDGKIIFHFRHALYSARAFHGLTAKVKTEIAKEQGLGEALAINVDTYRSVVSLNGFVDSQDQIDKAMNCARRIEGVTEVKNNLSVKPKSKS